eukprot:1274225-Pleurochrysis_carterae.AAC.1
MRRGRTSTRTPCGCQVQVLESPSLGTRDAQGQPASRPYLFSHGNDARSHGHRGQLAHARTRSVAQE